MRGEPLLLVTMYGKGSLAGEQLGRAEARLCQSFAWVTVYCARGGLIELCTRVLKTTGAVETKGFLSVNRTRQRARQSIVHADTSIPPLVVHPYEVIRGPYNHYYLDAGKPCHVQVS